LKEVIKHNFCGVSYGSPATKKERRLERTCATELERMMVWPMHNQLVEKVRSGKDIL
jgi:hypothetical protein